MQRPILIAATVLMTTVLSGCSKSPESTVESFYKAVGKGEIKEAKSYLSAEITSMLDDRKLTTSLSGEAEKIAACGGIKSVDVKLQGEGEIRSGVATVAYKGNCQKMKLPNC